MQVRAVTTLAFWIAWLLQPAFADGELAAYAREARIEIAPLTGNRTISLPPLDFSVRAKFYCPDDAVAESVTISVADAYQRFAPQEDDASLDTVIRVPSNQIAPITAGDFCADDTTASAELLLDAVATAQLSLRCAAEADRSVSYASLRLPLRLVCKADQEPSAELPSPAR